MSNKVTAARLIFAFLDIGAGTPAHATVAYNLILRNGRAFGCPSLLMSFGPVLPNHDRIHRDFFLLAMEGELKRSASTLVCFHNLYNAASALVPAYGLAHLRSDLIGCVRLGYV